VTPIQYYIIIPIHCRYYTIYWTRSRERDKRKYVELVLLDEARVVAALVFLIKLLLFTLKCLELSVIIKKLCQTTYWHQKKIKKLGKSKNKTQSVLHYYKWKRQ